MIGPTQAMAKAFAPSVVMPPCANKNTWKSNTIQPTTDIAIGPTKAVPNPMPVAWELLPVTDGSLSEDKTNAKATTIANIMRLSGA